jgi:hypothetical protein
LHIIYEQKAYQAQVGWLFKQLIYFTTKIMPQKNLNYMAAENNLLTNPSRPRMIKGRKP